MDSNDPYDVCVSSLQWAKERDYKGYDPYDGLNSPILDVFAKNWLTRLFAIHGMNKAPVNLRPILRVPKERNPKGIALFANAYLDLYRQTSEEEFLDEVETLLNWLAENQSPVFDLPSWGYNFDWQNGRKFFLPAYHPSIVVTTFVGRSFLDYYELSGADWALDIARDAAEFIQNNINQQNIGDHEVFTYTPYDSFILINTNALAADYFYKVSNYTDLPTMSERAADLFEFVVQAQADSGGWYYAMPPEESHLSHDNFHTGFILESLSEYASDQPDGHPSQKAYQKGMQFYRDNLFETDGAPRFESDQRYPYDAHASAQGIITFTQRDNDRDRELAQQICQWSIENLYDDDGYFYRRIGRVLTDDTPYMRWSQAWMCRALSKLNLRSSEDD